MNKEEFKKYVIAEAHKYLFSKENGVPAKILDIVKENVEISAKPAVKEVSASDIKRLAEEMKKINKTIDLRNPLISESDDSLVESIINNKAHGSKGAALDLDKINKEKHVSFKNEGEKDKWNRMLNYDVPLDDERP